MRFRLVATGVAMSWLVGCAYPLMAQTVCRPADALAARTTAEFQTIVTSTDSIEKASRDSLRLAPTTASNVKLVTDSRTCQKALDAFNVIERSPGAPRVVYVFQIGKSYAVEDPLVTGGEYRAIRIYNSRWEYQSTMMGF